MDDPSSSPAGVFSSEGLVLVAKTAAACRALPASHALATTGSRAVDQLLARTDRLISLLTGSIVGDLDSLERANDKFLQSLDVDLAILDGKPLPTTPSVPLIGKSPTVFQKIKIPRPQYFFKDKIDNTSETLWEPKIKNKPNAITPLQLMHQYDLSGKAIGYVHPYSDELRAYKPLNRYSQPTLKPNITIKDKATTPLKYIDTKDDLNLLVVHLNTVKEIAVDLEHHSYRSFQGIACLIQLTTWSGGDYLLDAIALREHLHVLNEPFTNPNILKVFHGAKSDVIWLQRDFGVYVVGLFDTFDACVTLNLPNRSLQYLLQKYCNESTNKQFQLSDWRQRPLTQDMIEYARSDTHNLLFIWRCLRKELLESNNANALETVFESGVITCLSTYIKSVYSENHHLELIRKSKKNFNSRQETALKLLYKWRDQIAREEDESTGYVLPNHMMLEIASAMPKETSGILACCIPAPPLLLHHLNTVHKMIMEARLVPLENILVQTTTKQAPKASFHLMVYDRQTRLNKFDGIKLPIFDTNITQKKSIMSSNKPDNLICERMDLCSLANSFCTPFERCYLVKKYNENIKKDESSKIVLVEPIIEKVPELLKSDELDKPKILFNSEAEQPPAKKKKMNDGEPEFVHEYKKPNKNNSNHPRHNSQKPESSFKPFDYKNFDYRSFNQSPKVHNNKKVWKKKQMNKNTWRNNP